MEPSDQKGSRIPERRRCPKGHYANQETGRCTRCDWDALPPVIQAMVESGMGAEELTFRIAGIAIQELRGRRDDR